MGQLKSEVVYMHNSELSANAVSPDEMGMKPASLVIFYVTCILKI